MNLSTDGLRVHTRFPAPLGCIIEVQVEPRPDAPDQIAIQARGRVTYVTPIAAKGEFAMGVRLRWGVSLDARIGPAKKHRTSKTIARQTTDLGQPVGEPDEESPVRKRRTLRRWPILLLLPLALLIWRGGRAVREGLLEHDTGREVVVGDSTSSEFALVKVGHEDFLHGDEGAPLTAPFKSGPGARPAETHFVGQRGGPSIDATLAMQLHHGQVRDRETDELHAVAEGNTEPGVLRLAHDARHGDADAEDEGAHSAPRARRTRHNARERERSGELDIVAAVRRGIEPTNTTALDPSEGIRLVIDRSAFTMTVYRGGDALQSFRVGVGENGRTPLGEFEIHNKLRNPDWYNKGEVVPNGHPRNPLGASWMGFSRDGRPISFGIHPTDNLLEVGSESGEGCVRMTPEDAETLFRLCPIGAKVTITDGDGA